MQPPNFGKVASSFVVAVLSDPDVRAAIRDAIGNADGGEFTSWGPLPAGVKRARFNRIAKTIPGAIKDGRGYRIPKPSWDKARAKPVLLPSGEDDAADRMLSAAGLRTTLRVVGGGGR